MYYLLFILIFLPMTVFASQGEELYNWEKQKYLDWYNYYEVYETIGNSMEHVGIYSGDTANVYPNQPCNIGDVCIINNGYTKEFDGNLTKQLKRIKVVSSERIYWFEGRPGDYPCEWDESLLCHSTDSRAFGWVSEGDIVGRVEL